MRCAHFGRAVAKACRKEVQVLPNLSKNEKALIEARIKTAAETYRVLGPLIKKARSARLGFLAYLLAMAAAHAKDEATRRIDDQSDPSGSTTTQPC